MKLPGYIPLGRLLKSRDCLEQLAPRMEPHSKHLTGARVVNRAHVKARLFSIRDYLAYKYRLALMFCFFCLLH